ncbi:hypothetical protein ACROYT_G011580 [Oculina patagonica]
MSLFRRHVCAHQDKPSKHKFARKTRFEDATLNSTSIPTQYAASYKPKWSGHFCLAQGRLYGIRHRHVLDPNVWFHWQCFDSSCATPT